MVYHKLTINFEINKLDSKTVIVSTIDNVPSRREFYLTKCYETNLWLVSSNINDCYIYDRSYTTLREAILYNIGNLLV